MTDDFLADAGADEIRALLHRSVAEVRPDPSALGRIRREVPRRRARRTALATGVSAAAVLLLAGGVSTYADHRATSTPPPPAADATGYPDCLRADLGQTATHLAPPDAHGAVYGWITVFNTTSHICNVTGGGGLRLDIAGAAGAKPKIRILDYRLGDPAPALPDPTTAPHVLKLDPLDGYQVQFALVPEGSDPASGPVTLVHTPPTGGAVVTLAIPGAHSGTLYRAAPQEIETEQGHTRG
ncbi:hypothetical protein [Kitasatospora sp. McL0602]|uniref:hypothetical protein n=1 Tax=Kitasatospora sp. McL0602 TaxID=3439530 RepID=UPI003F8A0950